MEIIDLYMITMIRRNHFDPHKYKNLQDNWARGIVGFPSKMIAMRKWWALVHICEFFAEQIFITISNRNVQVQPFREHSESGSFGTAGDGNMKQLCTKHN